MHAELRPVPSERGKNSATSIAAATVGAQLLPARELDAHELTAARTVLHRAEADLDLVVDSEAVLRPAERRQLQDRTALEGPCRHLALVVDDGEMKPGMRVDE